MERVAFLIEETGQRLECLLNPETLVLRRTAGVAPRRSTTGRVTGAGMTDDPENIRQVTAFVRSLEGVCAVDILPFHRIADGKYRRLGRDNPMTDVPPLSRQDVLPVAEVFSACGLSATLGG